MIPKKYSKKEIKKYLLKSGIAIVIQWWLINTLGWTLILSTMTAIAVIVVSTYKLGYLKNTRYHAKVELWEKYIKLLLSLSKSMYKPDYPTTFQINASQKSTSVTFSHNSKVYILLTQYDSALVRKMRPMRIFLVRDKEETRLNLIPGVPCMLTPSEIGGDKVIVRNLVNDIIQIFERNEVVSF